MNINGCEIELIPIQNSVIYDVISNADIVTPKVPTYEAGGVERDNPSHPVYNDALMVLEVSKNTLAINAVLDNAIKIVSMSDTAKEMWNSIKDTLSNQTLIDFDVSEDLAIKKYFIFREHAMLDIVTNKVLLTEERVARYYNSVSVVRDGANINQVSLKHAVRTNIEVQPIFVGSWQLVSPVDEYQASISSLIPWHKWPTLSVEQKANTIALHRIKRVIEVHSDDAVQIESERKSKSKS